MVTSSANDGGITVCTVHFACAGTSGVGEWEQQIVGQHH